MANSRSQIKQFDRSLVEGPILKSVWKLAWPTILQNMLGGLQGIIDHTMVGHFVGYTGNAAIGVSWQIFLVVVVFISSLFSGMGIMVARFTGAGEPDKVNRTVYQAFLTAIFLACGILAPLGYFLAPQLLALVHAAPEVAVEALPYLRITFVFSLGMLVFFMLGGALRAAGDAKTPLRLGIFMTVMNITFNVIFIRGLGPIPAFGTRGAAMGTVLASGIIAATGLYMLFSRKLVIQFSAKMRWRPDWQVIGSLFRLGLPTGFQGIAMNIAGVILLRFIGSLQASAEAQAAYSVGYTELFSLITWTSVGLMGATSAVVGQNLGAGKLDRARNIARTSAKIGLSIAFSIGLVFLFFPRSLFGFFGLQNGLVLDLGTEMLRYLSVSGLFIIVALTYTGALQGAGDTRSPFYISVISQIIVPLGYCSVMQSTRGLMPHDIWLAIVMGHFTRGLLSVLQFQRGKWVGIKVEIGPEKA